MIGMFCGVNAFMAESSSIEIAFCIENLAAPFPDDRFERRAALHDSLPRKHVGIDDPSAACSKHLRNSCLF
jgi:hypothetical protein